MKDFSTITLRYLNEQPSVVSILNQYMRDKDIKTGQNAIIGIVNDYASYKNQLKQSEVNYREFKLKSDNRISELEYEVKKLKSCINKFNDFMTAIQEIDSKT